MSDEHLRALERRLANGDRAAALPLQRARLRAQGEGEIVWMVSPIWVQIPLFAIRHAWFPDEPTDEEQREMFLDRFTGIDHELGCMTLRAMCKRPKTLWPGERLASQVLAARLWDHEHVGRQRACAKCEEIVERGDAHPIRAEQLRLALIEAYDRWNWECFYSHDSWLLEGLSA